MIKFERAMRYTGANAWWLAIVACLTSAACTQDVPSAEDNTSVRVEVSIASDATFAPFHYLDDAGNVTGFDIELARELAMRAGYEPRVIVVPYAQLFEDLLASKHNVVAATTGITPERETKFLFSAPYFDTCQAALVRNSEGEPRTLAELAGLRVGAAGAGTSVRALRSLDDVIPILLSEREATEETILPDGSVPVLEQREIDALIVDEFDAVDAARQSDGRLRVLPDPVAMERYGLVYAPDSAELKLAFDDALSAMREDGSLAALEQRFGLDRDADWPVMFPTPPEL